MHPKKLSALLILILLLVAVFPAAVAADGESVVYGDGVSISETTAIADILADPQSWTDKEVRVEGRVVGVCPHKGCWIAIESADHDRVRIKVEDDVIVFPADSEGSLAVAQGIVSFTEMNRDQWISWQSHLAEERGETFDSSSVGEGPFPKIQIESKGAELTPEKIADER